MAKGREMNSTTAVTARRAHIFGPVDAVRVVASPQVLILIVALVIAVLHLLKRGSQGTGADLQAEGSDDIQGGERMQPCTSQPVSQARQDRAG